MTKHLAELLTESETKKQSPAPRKWGIWLEVGGDLRFLSHHDCLRAVHRVAARAGVPLRWSRGFNPHPQLRLALPRPVGVASRDDLVILTVEAPIDGAAVVESLNAAAPGGMRFLRAAEILPGQQVLARQATYVVPVPAERAAAVRETAAAFAAAETWPVRRESPAKTPGRPPVVRTVDLRQLVKELSVQESQGPESLDCVLHFALAPAGDLWARPEEVLAALGLEPSVALADLVRVSVDYGLDV